MLHALKRAYRFCKKIAEPPANFADKKPRPTAEAVPRHAHPLMMGNLTHQQRLPAGAREHFRDLNRTPDKRPFAGVAVVRDGMVKDGDDKADMSKSSECIRQDKCLGGSGILRIQITEFAPAP